MNTNATPQLEGAGRSRIAPLPVLAVLMIGMAGCGTKYKAVIESNTSWSGAQATSTSSSSISGSGNKDIDLGEKSPVCLNIQKNTIGGTLHLKIIKISEGIFSDDEDTQVDVSTSASYGTVAGCSE